MLGIIATVALFAAPETVVAVEEPPVSWVNPPEPKDSDYPRMASHLGLRGMVKLQCDADSAGVPINCHALTATPAGLGFETSAINIVQRARLTPAVDAGSTRSFSVNLPFYTAEDEPDEAWTGPEPSAAQREAGRVAANRIIRNVGMADRYKRNWQTERLPPEQRIAVEAWLDELALPQDRERNLLSNAFAHVMAKYDLQEWPRQRPDNYEALNRAMGQLIDHDPIFEEISRRYCAAFACLPAQP